MLKRFLLAAMLLLMAACQSAAPTETSTETIPNSSEPQWLETQMNGVSLGMWKPRGWETDVSDGLVLAEHTISTSGSIESGMLIYVFVPPVDDFHVAAGDSNFAWAVLNQVVKMPSHTGNDVSFSQPASFEWDAHDAAYYLLTTGDGVRAVVLALALPGESKVVVCNISVPMAQADRIRAMIPRILDGLTINGMALDGTALDRLPDPLPFPRYSLAARSSDQTVASNSP